MAIGWIYLKYLNTRGIFKNGRARILDIGYQNLFDLPEGEGLQFFNENSNTAIDDLELKGMINELSIRSKYPRGPEGTKGVYFSELADLCQLEYLSYDIFAGDHVRVFDLNSESAPSEHCGTFDCVLNFGTTEHVFNQYNAFKVIHDVTRRGGHMFHQVPTVGYVNHGYWTYSPRTLLELAAANGYSVEAFWITGPQGTVSLDVQAQTPELTWDNALPENSRESWSGYPVPSGLINALLRKLVDAPFRLALDTTTSNDAPDSTVAERYRDT